MATAYYPSPDGAEAVDVEFLSLQGDIRLLRLLVDSGFTGRSSVLLGADATELVHAQMPPTVATGALQGAQNRAWVSCRIAALGFHNTLIAIFADLTPLSLPSGIHGLVGLSFLRQFVRWGAEHTAEGWRFGLSTD